MLEMDGGWLIVSAIRVRRVFFSSMFQLFLMFYYLSSTTKDSSQENGHVSPLWIVSSFLFLSAYVIPLARFGKRKNKQRKKSERERCSTREWMGEFFLIVLSPGSFPVCRWKIIGTRSGIM